MCNSVSQLKEKLEAVTSGVTMKNTGWYVRSQHDGRFGSSNEGSQRFQLLTENNICLGKVTVSPNGDRYGYVNEARNPMTMESARGVLTTMFSVAASEASRETAGLFGKLLDVLATQCFQVSEVRVQLGKGDAEITLHFTNGFISVQMEVGDCVNQFPDLKLELGDNIDYIVTPSFLKAVTSAPLPGSINNAKLLIRGEDKNYSRICTLSAYAWRSDEKRSSSVVTFEQLDSVVSLIAKGDDLARVHAVITEAARLIRKNVGDVQMTEVRLNQYQHESRKYLAVTLESEVGTYSLGINVA